jgi:D-arabinose 1-dehydrogenase-like Zn-dependent alcohol dehydrogenase
VRRRDDVQLPAQQRSAAGRTGGGAGGLGGLAARVILATVTNGEAMGAVVGSLGTNGTLMVIGAAPSLTVSPGQLIGGSLSVKGWYFSVLTGVRSMNEVYPLERVAEAYERMMSTRARFRVVLTMNS